MSHGDLAQLEVVRARIEELQERHWFAEKHGRRERAEKLARELLGAQAKRKQLVDRIINQHAKRA